tara:strand:- start:4641 stop:5219 length:579 start_codon:yes stop_codon:yes gene_type:complete
MRKSIKKVFIDNLNMNTQSMLVSLILHTPLVYLEFSTSLFLPMIPSFLWGALVLYNLYDRLFCKGEQSDTSNEDENTELYKGLFNYFVNGMMILSFNMLVPYCLLNSYFIHINPRLLLVLLDISQKYHAFFLGLGLIALSLELSIFALSSAYDLSKSALSSGYDLSKSTLSYVYEQLTTSEPKIDTGHRLKI